MAYRVVQEQNFFRLLYCTRITKTNANAEDDIGIAPSLGIVRYSYIHSIAPQTAKKEGVSSNHTTISSPLISKSRTVRRYLVHLLFLQLRYLTANFITDPSKTNNPAQPVPHSFFVFVPLTHQHKPGREVEVSIRLALPLLSRISEASFRLRRVPAKIAIEY